MVCKGVIAEHDAEGIVGRTDCQIRGNAVLRRRKVEVGRIGGIDAGCVGYDPIENRGASSQGGSIGGVICRVRIASPG